MILNTLHTTVIGAALLFVSLIASGCATTTPGHRFGKGGAENNVATPAPTENRITKGPRKQLTSKERKELVAEYKALMNDI